MKKFVLIPALILAVIMIVSFIPNSDADDTEELVIKVTADKVTKFDMFKYANPESPKTIKGLKTPYEFVVKTMDGKFIFKSKNSRAEIKVEVKSKKRICDRAMANRCRPSH